MIRFDSLSGCRQRGLSLIELLMALSFVSAVLSAIFVLDNVRVAMEVRNVIHIIASAKDIYRAKPGYKGINNKIAAVMRIVPEGMVKGDVNASSVVLRNRWGGFVDVSADRFWFRDDAVRLTYQAIPSDVCLNLLTATVDLADMISISGIIVKNSLSEPKVVFDVNRSAEACRVSKQVTMVWKTL